MIGQSVRRAMLKGQGVGMKMSVRTIYPQISSNVVSGVPRTRIPFPVSFLVDLPIFRYKLVSNSK